MGRCVRGATASGNVFKSGIQNISVQSELRLCGIDACVVSLENPCFLKDTLRKSQHGRQQGLHEEKEA